MHVILFKEIFMLGKRGVTWAALSVRLQSLQGKKVCVCGDFNAVRRPEERRSLKGGGENVSDYQHFCQFIDDNELIDLPLCGRRCTWFKGDGSSMSRLDRFLLSKEWCLQWPNCIQIALLRGLSDHCPIQLFVDEENWGPRPLKMLKCWQDMLGYQQFVTEKWNSFQLEGWGGFVLCKKLKLIKAALKEWHLAHAHNIPGKIDNLKNHQTELDDKGEDDGLSAQELLELREVSQSLHSLSRVNTSIIWQQSRLHWLKDGDANSRYFHSVLPSRQRRNSIVALLGNGILVEEVVPIRNAVFSHFKDHYATIHTTRPRVENLPFKNLSYAEGSGLIKPFSIAEVKEAVWGCDSYKSSGPEGVNFGFIKQFWDVLKDDVMRFITEFHRNGKLSRGINNTFIAFIPKIDSPQRVNDFRPISLVGSLYKILAKVLANRLKIVMGKVVSDTQTTFVKNRQILDGILIANEVVDKARKEKKELMLFKVDFEKAYNSVDWGYLDTVMKKMAFPLLWRKWIKECVSTATASILVNGSPTEEFPMQRGLHQRDPLSPFLFLPAAEGLNVMMSSVVRNNLFT